MLRLTLRQLEILEAVARHGSFSRASKDVHLTQPAVSMQIKQLEESLGLPLFEHVGKKIHLTEAGRETLATSQAIGRELDNLEHTLADLQGLRGGTLKISVTSTASYFAARLMALFRQVHPEVHISLNVVNRATLLNHLTGNSVDLALMGQPPEGMGLTAEPFMENPLVVIASPNHPLAQLHDIPLARLARETLVGREPGSGTRGAVENTNAVLRAQGLPLPDTIHVTPDLHAKDHPGALIVAPPGALGSTWARRFRPASTGFASGWMRLRGVRRRRAADRGFVISDHADWPALNAAIKATGADNIYVTHGYTDIFARWLTSQGYNAQVVPTEFTGDTLEEGAGA